MIRVMPGADPASSQAITAPLMVWLLAQLGALSFAAARVPLAAHYPQPAEALAVEAMIVIQFSLAATLFPFLLRDRRCCLAAVLTAAPMLQLAGLLAATPARQLALAWCCLTLWLIGLALLRSAGGTTAIGVAIALMLSLGGLLLRYLEAEFAGPVATSRYLPLPATLDALRGSSRFVLPLSSTGIWAILALALFVWRRRFRAFRAQRGASALPTA